MSHALKNIAVAGAAGNLGSRILRKLQADASFQVTVLRRPSSSSTFSTATRVIEIDHHDVPALTAALHGQDALLMTFGTADAAAQIPFIEAAVAAGVRRIVPCNYGSNLSNPNTRNLPIFADRIEIQDKLERLAEEGKITYSSIYNGAFLDWGINVGFIFDVNNPFVIDGGDVVFSATSVDSVAQATVGMLHRPEETKNKHLRIEDIKLTQNKLFELAGRAIPGRVPSRIRQLVLDEMVKAAQDRFAKGDMDQSVFTAFLYRSLFDPSYGANFESTDNELLGVEQKGEDYIIGVFKALSAE